MPLLLIPLSLLLLPIVEIAVFIMVVLASLFLYVSDQVLAYLVSIVLGFGV